MLAAVFFESSIYHYTADPSIERTLIFIMNEVFIDLYKSLLQNVSCFLVITGILKTHGIKPCCIPPVQELLIPPVSFKATVYYIFNLSQG